MPNCRRSVGLQSSPYYDDPSVVLRALGVVSGEPATALDRPSGAIDALLRLVRDQLGMDAAFLNTFDGDQRTFRNLQSLWGSRSLLER
jgi:hypothetical protein